VQGEFVSLQTQSNQKFLFANVPFPIDDFRLVCPSKTVGKNVVFLTQYFGFDIKLWGILHLHNMCHNLMSNCNLNVIYMPQ
jgi:hypothetical protein